jgi:hypothetical protein
MAPNPRARTHIQVNVFRAAANGNFLTNVTNTLGEYPFGWR